MSPHLQPGPRPERVRGLFRSAGVLPALGAKKALAPWSEGLVSPFFSALMHVKNCAHPHTRDSHRFPLQDSFDVSKNVLRLSKRRYLVAFIARTTDWVFRAMPGCISAALSTACEGELILVYQLCLIPAYRQPHGADIG